MVSNYGVLRGSIDRWVREDGDGSSPHLQIRVLDGTGQPWRIAVNVQSSDASHVVYWLVDPLRGHPLLAGLPVLPTGFTAAPPSATSTVDYVRAPLFAWESGVALRPSGDQPADDLQDLLILHLRSCAEAGGEVYAFGSRFDRNLNKPIDREFGNTDGLHGIHNIHLNQGNVGQFAGDNGVFRDGGLILAHPDRFVGLFLAFQTQRVPTTESGAAAAGAKTIRELIGGALPPATSTAGPVYLERALLNPAGPDAGREVVVIGNLANAETPLDGWQLVDRNNRVTTIAGLTLAPGGSVLVPLDGSGAQLSNNGGNLMLRDPAGRHVDAVVFTADDAKGDDRFVRFSR
ncbi:DUF2278 family protein [Virgisporangium aurantiacum]|uniref:LTD domain-containing protein n=1 Tax=Virgisporangium aurantiacum TaxID=175570 RepID=A0A8J3ZC21_9ACTN|nr:DUF2278 family protein [Virgisporangium aurantiacum]GIJ61429.1 hypothetical protein Vau01_089450 [Virgisporangium aurantiacum]